MTSLKMLRHELALPPEQKFYAVVDVEALVLGYVVNVVEQIAFVLYDDDGREVWAEKHFIYQPYDNISLVRLYGVPLEIVERSVAAYKRITGDEPVHNDPHKPYERWSVVRRHVQKACQYHARRVYAKGISLETSVFYGNIEFLDLAWWGCPKYPLALHDPLQECRFFAMYIPEIRARSTLSNSSFGNGYWPLHSQKNVDDTKKQIYL